MKFSTALAVAFFALLTVFLFCFAVVTCVQREPLAAVAVALGFGPLVGKFFAYTLFPTRGSRRATPISVSETC